MMRIGVSFLALVMGMLSGCGMSRPMPETSVMPHYTQASQDKTYSGDEPVDVDVSMRETFGTAPERNRVVSSEPRGKKANNKKNKTAKRAANKRSVSKPEASKQKSARAPRAYWRITGAIAVKRGKKGWTAQMRWQQTGRRYQMFFSGPLGAASTQLNGQPGRVQLRSGEKQPLVASSPEALLKKAWGWTLPVSNLYYWMRGLPAPGVTANVQRDNKQRLKQLVQQGWRITYQRYMTSRGVSLPTKLTLVRHNMRVRIVVRTWG